ncbi:MAG: hypothetical protein ACFFKA_21030 [Candidatus Thorarchaeota archaeon]
MAVSEWQHASWVSFIGKIAWLIGLVNGLIGLIFSIASIATLVGLLGPFGLIGIAPLVWNIIASIVGIIIALFIIRPKFSNPCGAKDWEALYGWTLKLGGAYVPWMFIWGILLFLFGWYGWGGLAVLIPAIMLIFAGPRNYNWSSKE